METLRLQFFGQLRLWLVAIAPSSDFAWGRLNLCLVNLAQLPMAILESRRSSAPPKVSE
jgi:hypothetical protein